MQLSHALSLTSAVSAEGSINTASLALEAQVRDGNAQIKLAEVPSNTLGQPELRSLMLDNQSILNRVPDAVSVQLSDTAVPGRISGTDVSLAQTNQTLEIGTLYLLSYEVTTIYGPTLPALRSSGPFEEEALPVSQGIHHRLITATSADIAAFLILSGDMEFSSLALYKAEWTVAMAGRGAEMAVNQDPGLVQGSGAVVSALSAALEIGANYEVAYEITEDLGGTLYFGSGAGSPFGFQNLPSSVGSHSIVVPAQDTDTFALMRVTNGGLRLINVSCRKVLTGGEPLQMTVGLATQETTSLIYTPNLNSLYVASDGSDTLGTGAIQSPFRQPSTALNYAQPGDTILLRPGVYQPIDVSVSGAPGDPISITTPPGEEHLAVIDGSQSPGAAGIRIVGQEHVQIQNLSVTNIVGASGISISNTVGTKGNLLIEGCLISGIDQSAIRCVGIAPGSYTGTQTDIFVENVTLRGNEINDAYRQGGPGNEVITVGGGVRNIVTENNDIHDSLQFGIDYKRGVDGGAIRNNRIWNIEKHAIYLDSSVSYVRNVSVHGNIAWNCNNGLVIAREAIGESTQALEAIDVFNNIFYDMNRYGILCYAHPGDGPHGLIKDVRLRFNTVYNCGHAEPNLQEIRLADWGNQAFRDAGVVSGLDVVGNIIWRAPSRGAPRCEDQFSASPAAFVADNFNMAPAGIGAQPFYNIASETQDPLFIDPTGTLTAPPATVPNFQLKANSPAAATVSGHVEMPFNTDILGLERTAPSHPGAHTTE
ncbi:MAG: right-handed parallel beta-helix repeat-containing protein [Pseudomonadota bacterium]